MRVIFCFALAVVLLDCNSGARLRGIYSTHDESNDSLEFRSGSKVIVNLDGERNWGTYKITDKTILINFRYTAKLILLTLVDDDTIVGRQNNTPVFTKWEEE